nr:MetaGeneMark_Unknown Function [uncultured bacterium]
MASLFDDDPFDFIVLPDEPLVNGWAHKWDDDALDYRFERFGLALKRSLQGYSIVHATTENILTLQDIAYKAIDRSFSEICEVLQDLEIAEILKRRQLRHEEE